MPDSKNFAWRDCPILTINGREIRDFVYGEHSIWRAVYATYMAKSNFNRVSYDTKLRMLPNCLWHHPAPYGRPPLYNWTTNEMPVEKIPAFNAFARKVAALSSVRHCLFCKTKQVCLNKFWSLGANVCTYCTMDRLVSDRVLYHKYGLDVSKPWKDFPNFMTACKFRCQKIYYSSFEELTKLPGSSSSCSPAPPRSSTASAATPWTAPRKSRRSASSCSGGST